MVRMFSWFLELWHSRCRKLDLEILWPSCCIQALQFDLGIESAKAAFAFHAFNDSAWISLGHAELIKFIDELKAPV